MFGLRIEKTNSGYFTDLCEVLDAMQNKASDYNWLLSDYECNVYPLEAIKEGQKYVWLSGDELINTLKGEDIQFIWCVASAFRRGVNLEQVLQHPLPIADGNESLWSNQFFVQNPLADFEIISWDADALFVISKLKKIVGILSSAYPNSSFLG